MHIRKAQKVDVGVSQVYKVEEKISLYSDGDEENKYSNYNVN